MSKKSGKVSSIITELNKKYKSDIVMRGDELVRSELLPFSSPRVNYLTRGGIAVGKMVEFYGGEGSGKTTTALDVVKNFQERNEERVALYLDAENTLDRDWGELHGVDWENMILIKPERESAETLLNMIIDVVKTGDVGLIVVDSIPFLVPQAVIEGNLEDKHYAGNSAVMTQFVNKVCPLAHKNGTTILMINQIRDMIGVPYTAYNTPGGRSLKHAYAQRFFFRKGKLIDENNKEVSNSFATPMGNLVEIKLEKNKVTKNDRKMTNYTLNYYTGIDVVNDTIDMAILFDVIKQGGAWFEYEKEDGEVKKVQGRSNMIKYFEEDSEEFKRLYDIVDIKLKEE